jgi:hypothetical protein
MLWKDQFMGEYMSRVPADLFFFLFFLDTPDIIDAEELLHNVLFSHLGHYALCWIVCTRSKLLAINPLFLPFNFSRLLGWTATVFLLLQTNIGQVKYDLGYLASSSFAARFTTDAIQWSGT